MTKSTTKTAAKTAKSAETRAPAKAAASTQAKSKATAKKAAPAEKKTSMKLTARKAVNVKASPKKDTKPMTKAQNTVVNETIEKMTTAGNEAFKEGFEKSLKSVNDVNAFTKDNVDAVIASATAAGKNAEALNANAVAYAKTSMESAVAATKALTSAKSVQDMIEVQTDFVKSSMDLFLAEMNKTTDLYAGAVKDVTKPINDRFAASVEMVQSAR